MIEINNVVKSFKNFKAVDGVSLQIKQGEFVALLGPNGAGKTTLVEMIEGLQKPDSGTISIEGKNWNNHTYDLRNIIGISLQETRFIDKLTVLETLDLFGSFYKLPKSRSLEVMEMVGLSEKAKAFTVNLSGGQKQKLALGVALLNNPKILILDEPTTGLDPNARRELWYILENLKNKYGTTLLLTTHYMEEAQYLCERIIILYKGKILATGSLEELLSTFETGEIIEFRLDKNIPEEDLKNLEGVKSVKLTENKYHLDVDLITNALPGILNFIQRQNAQLFELECRKKTLDDLFISLTGKRLDE